MCLGSVFVCARANACVHNQPLLHLCVCSYVCMCVCVFVCVYVCVCYFVLLSWFQLPCCSISISASFKPQQRLLPDLLCCFCCYGALDVPALRAHS